MSNFTYGDELYHFGKKKGSKYAGGFGIFNGRLNNTSAYNHDYYIKNKIKWAKESIQGAAKKKKKSIKDKVNDFINGVRDKAIDSISDFMVDVSMAYLKKMLSDENLATLNIDKIAYDMLSPVANKVAEEAASKAADAAMTKVSERAASVVKDTVTQATNTATKTATETVTKTVEQNVPKEVTDTVSTVYDFLRKKK